MKLLSTSLCTAVITLSLSACFGPKTLSSGKSVVPISGPHAPENSASIDSYLAEKDSGPAHVNLEGVYYSPEWGIVILKQDQEGGLTGIFQDYYHVYGLVSGKEASIVLVDDRSEEFTVELSSKGSGRLEGAYSGGVPFSEEENKPTSLQRLSL